MNKLLYFQVNLMEHFKSSTSRDFRINVGAVQAALDHDSDEGEEEEEDEDNDETNNNTRQVCFLQH